MPINVEYTRFVKDVSKMVIYVNPNNDGLKQALNSNIYVDKSGMIEVTKCNTEAIESRDQAFALLVHLGFLAYDEKKKKYLFLTAKSMMNLANQ